MKLFAINEILNVYFHDSQKIITLKMSRKIKKIWKYEILENQVILNESRRIYYKTLSNLFENSQRNPYSCRCGKISTILLIDGPRPLAMMKINKIESPSAIRHFKWCDWSPFIKCLFLKWFIKKQIRRKIYKSSSSFETGCLWKHSRPILL